LQTKRNQLLHSVDRIPQIEAEFTQLMRGYDVYKKNYADMLTRRETATRSSEVESKTDVVEFRVFASVNAPYHRKPSPNS
jgi:uncharacterized protein involved in exopolysaccharide biosynthesis